MSRLYTRRDRMDFVVFMLHPAFMLLAAVVVSLVIARWLVG